MSTTLVQAASRELPAAGTKVVAPLNATSAAIDISAHKGKFLTFKIEPETALVHIRGGPDNTVVSSATDLPLRDGEEYRVPENGIRNFIAVYGDGAAADVYYAVTSS